MHNQAGLAIFIHNKKASGNYSGLTTPAHKEYHANECRTWTRDSAINPMGLLNEGDDQLTRDRSFEAKHGNMVHL